MRIAKKFYVAAASLVVAVGALVALNATAGQAISSFRNCNDDAIIRCGALSEAELLQKYDQNVGDVQAVYKHYGITRADLAGTASTIKHGTVYRDGRVVVDGKTVATGAYSVSRIKYTSAGQPTPVVINGTTYYQGPSMQIFTGPVDAFVYMRNGQFHKAVLSSCGNPLIATPEKPEPKPVHTCDGLTATKIDRTRFRFTAAATAKDGAEVVSYTFNFGDGKSETVTANTIEHTYAQAGNYNITVSVNVRVNGQTKTITGANCKTNVKVDDEPKKPVAKCDLLEATKISRTDFRFTTKTTAQNGAKVVKYTYDFGDGSRSTTTQSTVSHSYDKPGNYSISVSVTFEIDGKEVVVTSPNCKTNVKVDDEPKKPVYECTSLTARHIQNQTYAFALSYRADGGAEFTKVTYNFGDGTSETFSRENGTNVEHTFAQPGNYTVTTTLYFSVNENGAVVEKTKNCTAKVSITPEVCPTNPNLPKDSPDCGPCPTNPNLPKDSPNCVPCPHNPELPKDSPECVETPPELPKTGFDMFLGGSLGLGSITAAGYYFSASRRSVLDALLKK